MMSEPPPHNSLLSPPGLHWGWDSNWDPLSALPMGPREQQCLHLAQYPQTPASPSAHPTAGAAYRHHSPLPLKPVGENVLQK